MVENLLHIRKEQQMSCSDNFVFDSQFLKKLTITTNSPLVIDSFILFKYEIYPRSSL